MKIEIIEDCFRVVILILYILFIVFYLLHLKNTNAFEMNAEPLTKQRLFKAAFIIPITSFLAFGAVAWTGHSFQLDADGLNNFLNISKLPLGLLSLSVPFGVIVNNIHRTIQTDTQIKEAQKKNKADAFYSHRKNTIEILEKIVFPTIKDEGEQKEFHLKIRSCYQLYRDFFPNASIEAAAIYPEKKVILFLERSWGVIATIIRDSKETNSLYDEILQLHNIEKHLSKINSYLKLSYPDDMPIYKKTFSHEEKSYDFYTKFIDEDLLKSTIFSYLRATIEIMLAVGLQLDESFSKNMTFIDKYVRLSEELYKRWGREFVALGREKGFALKVIDKK